MKKIKGGISYFLIIVLIAFFTSVITGCEPLRKKFVREKKKDQQVEVQPVLEPIEYPPHNEIPQDRYAYHYSLWKVWEKELASSLDDTNDKKQKYLLEQLMTHLEGMRNNIIGKDRQIAVKLLDQLENFKGELYKPRALRNIYIMKRRLARIDKDVRQNLSPKLNLQYGQ